MLIFNKISFKRFDANIKNIYNIYMDIKKKHLLPGHLREKNPQSSASQEKPGCLPHPAIKHKTYNPINMNT